jgi:hypothetical protein
MADPVTDPVAEHDARYGEEDAGPPEWARVDRAEAIYAGDIDRLLAAAAALDAARCRYQHARTLIFARGDARAEGESILAAIGAAHDR